MTKRNRKYLLPLFFITFFPVFGEGSQESGEILIASGAGYKKPVLQICETFMKESPVRVDSLFGNMQTVSLQVKESGKVGLLIGDRKFLENPQMGVRYSDYLSLGKGRLVLAWRKGISLSSAEELTGDKIERISLPDTQKAIYGTAACEYLTGLDLWDPLQDKILIASTVPQVSSYLISGEVDGGFINLTDAIAIADQIGGYLILDRGYSEITIVAGVVEGFGDDGNLKEFLNYLASPEASSVFESYGL